ARTEEAFLAHHQGAAGMHSAQELTRQVVDLEQAVFDQGVGYRADVRLADGVPEGVEPFDAPFGWVAGDDGHVQGANGNAGQVRQLDASFLQALVDAGLVGPQGAAALENQGAGFVGPGCVGRAGFSLGHGAWPSGIAGTLRSGRRGSGCGAARWTGACPAAGTACAT